MLGLSNYREFLFSTSESADGKSFSGSKVFCFTIVESVRNFVELFSKRNVYSKFYEGTKLLKLFVVLEINLKCFPSSKFEPRSFAKCLQNLLIEKKSVERLWRFSKGWT